MLQSLYDFQHGIFTLSPDYDVDEFRLKSLERQQGRVPSTKDDREVRVPELDASRNLHGFPNHGACDQRDSEAYRVANLIENALLVVRGDRGVDQSHVVSRAQERRGDGEQTKRSRGLRARKSRKKQHDLTGGLHCRKNTNRSGGPMSRSNPAGAKKLSTPGTSKRRKNASRGLFV